MLWHERDISHSSVERLIAPDACVTLDFMLHRFAGLVEHLRVLPDRIRANIDQTRGLGFSGSVLLALVEGGLSREDAYRIVQTHALAAWEAAPGLEERLCADETVRSLLPPERIKAAFSLEPHLAQVDYIFSRVLAN